MTFDGKKGKRWSHTAKTEGEMKDKRFATGGCCFSRCVSTVCGKGGGASSVLNPRAHIPSNFCVCGGADQEESRVERTDAAAGRRARSLPLC